jgi:hypothetical protein
MAGGSASLGSAHFKQNMRPCSAEEPIDLRRALCQQGCPMLGCIFKMHRRYHRLNLFNSNTEFPQDWHQGFAKCVECFQRFPNINHHPMIALLRTDMVVES